MNSVSEQKEKFSPAVLFGSIPILKFQMLLEMSEPDTLPPFLGSAFRGVVGWEMKRLVCPYQGKENCNGCIITTQCPYHLLIEKKMKTSEIFDAPKGYVFYSPFEDDKQYRRIEIILFGDCARMVPVLVKAIFNGQKSGLGKGWNQYRITRWQEIIPNDGRYDLRIDPEAVENMKGPYPLSDWMSGPLAYKKISKMLIQTPLRLRQGGKYLGEMDWKFFTSIIIRRLESLNMLFNAGEAIGKENYGMLQNEVSNLKVTSEKFHWRDLSRYSSRQKVKVPLGGIVGHAMVKIENENMYQLLKAGCLIHIGKGTTMGLGKIDIL